MFIVIFLFFNLFSLRFLSMESISLNAIYISQMSSNYVVYFSYFFTLKALDYYNAIICPKWSCRLILTRNNKQCEKVKKYT